MNLVDSCGWLEFFADGPNADFFAEPLAEVSNLLVPTICVLEVFKRILAQRGEGPALQAAAAMGQGKVEPLEETLALEAARLGVQYKLPLADSVILATAQAHKATIWTQDADFEGLPSVKFIQRKS